jgi:hypothetical protein
MYLDAAQALFQGYLAGLRRLIQNGSGKRMNIRKQFGRAAGIAAAAIVAGLAGVSMSGSASAATAGNPINGPVHGCVFQTVNGHYLTAVGGGGRTTDVIHTDATAIGAWEKFTLVDSGSGTATIQYGIETSNGHYLTAVGGGGRTTDVIHSDATQLQGWEMFTLYSIRPGVYDIQTINGHYLTAVGGGGLTTDTIHSDATTVGSWEEFTVSCGH